MHGNKSDSIYSHEKIKSRLHLGNGWYHTVQNIQSSCLPSDNIKLKTQRTKFLLFVLCGCENIASHVEGRSQTEGAGEQGGEENTWTQKGEIKET